MNFSRIVFIFVCLFVSSDLHATGQSGGSLMDTLLSLSRTVQPSIMFDQSKTLNDPKYAEVLKREEVVPPVYRSKPPKENCFVRLFKWVFGGCCRKARVEFQDDIDENSVSLSITTPSDAEGKSVVEARPLNFRPETSESLNRVLVKEYREREIDQQWGVVKLWSLSMLGQMSIFGGSAYLMPLLLGASSTAAVGMGGGIAIFVLFERLAFGSDQILRALYCIYGDSMTDVLRDDKIKYAHIKRHLPVELQEAIETKLRLAAHSESGVEAAQIYLRYALKVPLKIASAMALLRLPSEEEIKKEFGGYDIEVLTDEPDSELVQETDRKEKPAERIESAAASALVVEREGKAQAVVRPKKAAETVLYDLCLNHVLRTETGKFKPKSIVWKEGPAGTGKSFMGRKVATMMKAKFATLDATGGAKSIIGTSTEPGALLQLLCSGIPTNSCIGIEEFDRILGDAEILQFILPFLDPKEEYFKSPFLGAPVYIGGFFFDLSGNNKIKDRALLSRLERLNVKRIRDDFKGSLLIEMIPVRFRSKLTGAVEELMKQFTQPGMREIERDVTKLINREEFAELQASRSSGGRSPVSVEVSAGGSVQ